MLDKNDPEAVSIVRQIRDQIPGDAMEGLVDQLTRKIGEK